MELSYKDKIDWLKLIRSENVGPKTFHALVKTYGSPDKALANIDELSRNGGIKNKIKIANNNDVEREIEKVENFGAKHILACEPHYPKSLLQLDDHPPVITVLGNKELLKGNNIVAIVGSRTSSTNGYNFTTKIASDLSKQNIIIISGMAKGIDKAAHEGSIDNGSIAVVACGIDQIYPPENKQLYHKLAEKGLIISELPIGTAPLAQHFPRRNRIISGMAKAILVIEAKQKSGSLITANFAKMQGKRIFAVPGFPSDPRAEGPNELIKNGAQLLSSANDVLEYLNTFSDLSLSDNFSSYTASFSMPSEGELAKYRPIFLEALSHYPSAIEDIAQQTRIPLPALNIIILELELAGKLERHYGNKICLIG